MQSLGLPVGVDHDVHKPRDILFHFDNLRLLLSFTLRPRSPCYLPRYVVIQEDTAALIARCNSKKDVTLYNLP